MAVSGAQLVGRAAEIRSLDRLLAALARGIPGALAIEGEPGIGKTRLLGELMTLAEDHELLNAAATTLDEHGALRYRDAAERELGRLGRRRPRRTRAGTADGDGIASLTERELQVARLIVDRRTNPQIAAALFLSQKTVESHVRNLFHKLGVSSRVDVARVIERAQRP